ncbi:MAG: DUF4381 domain-containing protein [Burkholderiales bacterium]|nr:DUF4381 domain-containing protein [Burkholderiales bacterium]
MEDKLLAQLKDVHLPPPVSMLPLAPGWYILIALVILIFSVVIYFMIKAQYKRKHDLKIYAMFEQINHNAKSNLIEETSILLKRVALKKFPQQSPHLLFEQEWLKFLDATGKTTNFTNGPGKVLLNIYHKPQQNDYKELYKVVKLWLQEVL